MKRFASLMLATTLLAPQSVGPRASYEDPRGPKRSAPAVKVKTEKEKKKAIAVPDPATIALLGAAAGVVVARKLWRTRQR